MILGTPGVSWGHAASCWADTHNWNRWEGGDNDGNRDKRLWRWKILYYERAKQHLEPDTEPETDKKTQIKVSLRNQKPEARQIFHSIYWGPMSRASSSSWSIRRVKYIKGWCELLVESLRFNINLLSRSSSEQVIRLSHTCGLNWIFKRRMKLIWLLFLAMLCSHGIMGRRFPDGSGTRTNEEY